MKMKSINMDLQQCGITPIIDAVQGDVWSRELEINLFSGKKPYYMPTNTTVLIRYRKADRTGGEYDTLPDGNPAWRVTDNRLTVILADQALTFPGRVQMTVSLIHEDKQLNSFPIGVNVHPNAYADGAASEDYFMISGFLTAPWNAREGQILCVSAVNAEGRVTEVEAVDTPESLGASAASVYLEENAAGVLICVTDKDGVTSSAQVRHGKDGTDGYTPIKNKDYFDGKDGTSVSIARITESQGDGGSNIVTFSDGKTLTVKNGRTGAAGKDGTNGANGADGYTPVKNVDYFDGKDGYSPVRGVDYWTQTDQESIVQQVITALGTPVFGTVDGENNIVLTGNLTDGTYILKYEDAQGNSTQIGTIAIGSSYTNLADPTSSDWLSGYRVNSSLNVVTVADENQRLTNIIPLGTGANQFHIKGLNVTDAKAGNGENYNRVIGMDADKNILFTAQLSANNFREYYSAASYDSTVVIVDVPGVIEQANPGAAVVYVRFCGYTADEDAVVITCDEQIV